MRLFDFFHKIKHVTPLTIDIHSHLLPNIDDGVKTLEESVAIIKRFQLLGYTKLITTPHVFSDLYPNTQDIIKEKLHIVREEIEKQNIAIKLEASAEYYLDMEFLRMIEDDELMPFINNYILFETPCSSKLIILEPAINALLEKGYIPVLAHPERYHYLYSDNLEKYKQLKRVGVLFQVNLKSLQSQSRSIRKIALKLIQGKLVDFLGSDVHRMGDIIKIEKVLKSREYQKIIEKHTFLNNI
jgi:tyrosine-protein phosphatase YwqE